MWMMLLCRSEVSGKRTPISVAGPAVTPKERSATPADAAAYLAALEKFAEKLNALRIDPTTLPAGAQMPEEAKALCAVRCFIERRYDELRSWVVPQAVMDIVLTGHAESGADQGERLSLRFQNDPACPDADNPRAWTWRGQDSEEYIIGDMLCALEHAAEALGIDWDAAEDAGSCHHDNELEDDELTKA